VAKSDSSDALNLIATLMDSPANFKSFLEQGGYNYSFPEPPTPLPAKKTPAKTTSSAKAAGGGATNSRANGTAAKAVKPTPVTHHPLGKNPKDFDDGFLKHVTFHEARKEALRPMKEAQDALRLSEKKAKAERKVMVSQIAGLISSFKKYKIAVAVGSIQRGFYSVACRRSGGV
jgi:hypothetical protein